MPDELEMIAYFWYYAKDGKGAQMHVRKVIGEADLFRFEELGKQAAQSTKESGGRSRISIHRLTGSYWIAGSRIMCGTRRAHIRNSISEGDWLGGLEYYRFADLLSTARATASLSSDPSALPSLPIASGRGIHPTR